MMIFTVECFAKNLSPSTVSLTYLQVIFMVIFTVECFAKIIAYGFWQHEEAYLRSTIFLRLNL